MRQRTYKIGKLPKDRQYVKVDYCIPNETTGNNGADGLTSFVNNLLGVMNGSCSNLPSHGEGAVVTSGLQGDNNFTSFMCPQVGNGGTTIPKVNKTKKIMKRLIN